MYVAIYRTRDKESDFVERGLLRNEDGAPVVAEDVEDLIRIFRESSKTGTLFVLPAYELVVMAKEVSSLLENKAEDKLTDLKKLVLEKQGIHIELRDGQFTAPGFMAKSASMQDCVKAVYDEFTHL